LTLLSRHVGAVTHEDVLDMNDILREQASDTFCMEQKTGAHHSKCEFFLDEEGLMYRRQTHDRYQLVIPKGLVHHIIKVHHDPVYAAHQGVKRTCNLIALSYWWPGMRKSVEDCVKRCDPCQ
jgi:hypothetical protein